MTSNAAEDAFRSITGAPESAEPAPHNPSQATMAHRARESSSNRPTPAPISASDSGPAAPPARHHSLTGLRSLNVSRSPSTANSPQSSRDTSPARPPNRQPGSAGPLHKSDFRSRKNSIDVSPNRGPNPLAGSSSTVPSAAAIQRALSSANIPQLTPTSTQDPSRVPRPLKAASGTNSGDSTPHWPISPRLKSPPPANDARSRSRRNSLRNQPKKPESSSTPAIVVQSSSPAPSSRLLVKDEAVNSDPEEQPVSMKGSSRGGGGGVASKLETVQEASLPTTPGFDALNVQSLPSTTQGHKSSDDERNDVTSKVTEDLSSKLAKHSESGSESVKNDAKTKLPEQRVAPSQRPSVLPSKASYSSLSTIKTRTEAPSKNMTVETETVPSIAQATIGNQDRSASGRGEGSLRLKPSNETIRPKKEKQKPKRKAPSINSGTTSSKADVFEQKVANAVDEANSSDSDATFIYESNPPDQPPHRSRHHSRTPSMTSVTSLADPRSAIRETYKNPGKKISMKFSNPHNNPADTDAFDRADGTVRSGRASGGNHHHHIGRHGQGRGALTHILMDSDSSMAQPSRIRGPSSRQASQPNSPRFHTFNMGNGNGNGNGNQLKRGEYSSYDIDAENAADDERTPLVQSMRSPRVRTPRQRNGQASRQQDRRHRRNGGWCRRFAGCLVLAILVLVLVFMAVGLVFATTKPLSNVQIHEIQNVIATEQELMLDLVVEAVNPNIVGVTVADMDIQIFAKSKHVGSDKWWREHDGRQHNEVGWHPISDSSGTVHTSDGVDEGTDPIEDPEVGEPRTMLLGRIFHFDSPLTFDGSFFKRHSVQSLGEVRLNKPGNKTEAGGTERWEEILQYPFELLVSGHFKYELPLSTHEHSVAVTASYHYDPDTEKKKLKTTSSEISSRNLLSKSVTISPRPPGRYDVRGRSLLLLPDA
ncbi:hypothetical protein CC78DRAFT_530869 [Lojkania enalia]|uniref:Vacuolar segregation protein 7 n=1 Tax=Lojkania enalia TaxID=147567 RepID=A0A9P4KIT0_9PLEO|nr:hypothetical protein CC78DRAFT_530869 [Didymosphaeria enalia]